MKRILPVLIILISGCVGAYLTYHKIHQIKAEEQYFEFQQLAGEYANSIVEELGVAREVTQSVGSLFDASEFVSFEEFKVFVSALLARHPSIQALEWVPKIKASGRENFVNKAKAYYPNYKITERDQSGLLQTRKPSDVYYPVYYMQPINGNESAVGFDLGSEQSRLLALNKARDYGYPVVTNFINLVQANNSSKKGFIIFVPQYENSTQLRTVDDRRLHLQGFVLAVFKVDELIAKSLDDKAMDFMDISIMDSVRSADQSIQSVDHQFEYYKNFKLADNQWSLAIKASDRFFSAHKSNMPLAGALLVLLAAAFIATYIWIILSQSDKVKKLVVQKTKDLNMNNKLLAHVGQMQKEFISGMAPKEYFSGLLQHLLDITESEYGFIGEVLHTEKGNPYLKTYAITDISWDEQTKQFYEEKAPQGLEFYSLDTLFGAVLTSENIVIANDPKSDPRSKTGIPKGHPDLKHFLGVPFKYDHKMIGMAGVANRQGGYSMAFVERIELFFLTCGYIINAHQQEQVRAKIEKENEYLACTDTITGIANRRMFDFELSRLTELARRNHEQCAILFVDLDDFKQVNDTVGHDQGDLLLKMVAFEMQQCIRGSDFIARIGGDEFAIILYAIKNADEPKIVAEHLLKIVEKNFDLNGEPVKVGMSIGVAHFPNDAQEPRDIIKIADASMYKAKQAGKNRYEFHR